MGYTQTWPGPLSELPEPMRGSRPDWPERMPRRRFPVRGTAARSTASATPRPRATPDRKGKRG